MQSNIIETRNKTKIIIKKDNKIKMKIKTIIKINNNKIM